MLISTHVSTNYMGSTWTQDMPWPCYASVLILATLSFYITINRKILRSPCYTKNNLSRFSSTKRHILGNYKVAK